MNEDEEFLAHYGVKGMKWGVRKQRPKSVRKQTAEINSKDRVIKAGTKFQRVMDTDTPDAKQSKRRQYFSYTDYDNKHYAELISGMTRLNGKEPYLHSYKVKKDIKVASDRAVVEQLQRIAKQDPKRLASDMYSAYRACNVVALKNQKYWDKKVKDLASGTDSKKTRKTAKNFITQAAHDEALGSSWVDFVKGMRKSGYDAISDLNDRDTNYLPAQDPLIVLNMRKLGHQSVVPLTDDVISSYVKARVKDLSGVKR